MMIERLPMEVFGGEEDDTDEGSTVIDASPVTPSPEVDERRVETHDAESAPALLVNCQWCAREFDKTLSECPSCGVYHRQATPAEVESAWVTCQWCLAEFERGPSNCPECDAMVVIPGQYMLGQDDPYPDFASLGILRQRARSHQFIARMLKSDGIDGLVAGLISLAITLLDDD